MTIKTDKLILFSLYVTLLGNALVYLNISIPTAITYLFMLLPIIVGMSVALYIRIIRKDNLRFEYTFELKIGIFLFLSFLIISFMKIQQTGAFTWGTLGESIRILVPFIYLAANANQHET